MADLLGALCALQHDAEGHADIADRLERLRLYPGEVEHHRESAARLFRAARRIAGILYPEHVLT